MLIFAIFAVLFIATVSPVVASHEVETDPRIAWNVTFSPEENSKFDAVSETADGGYIALGTVLTKTFGGKEDLLLVKTDGLGNEIWTQRLPDLQAASVAEIDDDGYIIGGYNVSVAGPGENLTYQGTSFLIRTDADGEEIWREVMPGEKISVVRPAADGGYAVIGWLWNPSESVDDTTAFITKTDVDGKPVWSQTFPAAAANAGIVTSDGGYVIGGTKSPFTYDVGDAFLIRLDGDGNVLWNKNYDVPVIFDIEETVDGRFVYSGNYWYGLVDSEGDEVWLKNMEGYAGYTIVLRPDEGYMIAGKNIMSGEGFAFWTDMDGEILQRMAIPYASVYAATSSRDGGYTFAGVQYLSSVSSAAWLANVEVPEFEGSEPQSSPTPTTPGFGAMAAGAALLYLVVKRDW